MAGRVEAGWGEGTVSSASLGVAEGGGVAG